MFTKIILKIIMKMSKELITRSVKMILNITMGFMLEMIAKVRKNL